MTVTIVTTSESRNGTTRLSARASLHWMECDDDGDDGDDGDGDDEEDANGNSNDDDGDAENKHNS